MIDFYPYPLLIGLFILTLIMVRNRKRGWLYLSALGLFGIYLLAAVDKLAFPIVIPERWPAYATWDEFWFIVPRMANLIPFYYGNMFSDVAAGRLSPNIAFWEIAGNILLTVPFGMGISLFYPLRGQRVFWVALATGLATEGTQLFILVFIHASRHSVDINDVLLNAFGVLVGYGIYRSALWAGAKVGIPFAQSRVS